MKTFPATPAAEAPPAPATNRRQPLRQTRTNPVRNAATTNQLQGLPAETQDTGHQPSPGFFPAITHFTDSIAALPREMTRNYTMLKEVDAKTYGPEEVLGHLIAEIRKAPVPPRKPAHSTPRRQFADTSMSSHLRTLKQLVDDLIGQTQHEPAQSQADGQESPDPADLHRRRLFYNLRVVINEMLGTLDEKNHVMSTANDDLNKQLARCDSSFRHLGNEISEEARCGSSNHWAYIAKVAQKKGTLAVERTRRDATANNPAAGPGPDLDGVASRSELRREALAARKYRNNQVDQELDDGRSAAQTATRKAPASGKGRKAADPALGANAGGLGVGIANVQSPIGPPSKRRKVEKSGPSTTPVGLPVERAMSTVYGPNGGTRKANSGSPRNTPTVEASKKKGRATVPANGTSRGRFEICFRNAGHALTGLYNRVNPSVPILDSPPKPSSPVAGTFIVAKDAHRKSPIPPIAQRAQPSRVRQNSATSLLQDTRARPSSSNSTTNKATNGSIVHANTTDMEKLMSSANKSAGDIKAPMKEATNSKRDRPFEDIITSDGPSEVRGASFSGSKVVDRPLKHEVTENGISKTRVDRPPAITVSTRGSGKLSKTTTPLNASFPEPSSRSRQSRTMELPIKRSHKKGAGLAAQLAAAAAAAHRDEEGSSVQGDEDEEEDEAEPRYCYCNQVSFGEMVACDMESCAREWFHLSCVGLTKAPLKNGELHLVSYHHCSSDRIG